MKSESLKTLLYPLNDTKEEITKLLFQFEEIISKVSVPFILEQKGLLNKIEINDRKLSLIELMEEYKNDTEQLNVLFNKLFKYYNEEIKIIIQEANEIKDFFLDLQRKIEDEKNKFIKILEEFNESENNIKYHNNLIRIKKSFIVIKDDIIKKKNIFNNTMNLFENENTIKINFTEIKDNYEEIFENINSKITTISNWISNKRILSNNQNYFNTSELYTFEIIANSIIKSLDRTFKEIHKETVEAEGQVEEFLSFIHITKKTSLDLLFIMDISASMDPYINQVKKNLINIMNKIINECPGIDIYVGIICYIDMYQNLLDYYINIDFTLNHNEIEKIIRNVNTHANNDDPEDLAWAMEMAINKTWTNNARSIVLVADNPCHGIKYHSLQDKSPNGIPNRKDIEESIEELARKNITLYCIKIQETTNQMFQIFENIYKKYGNCKFSVVPLNNDKNLPDIIVNSASEAYINQKNTNR